MLLTTLELLEKNSNKEERKEIYGIIFTFLTNKITLFLFIL